MKSLQYGEVHYFDGDGEYNYPTCDKSKKWCWAITPEYFVVLANGDIAQVHVDKNALPLRDMHPGDNFRVKGDLWGIFRNQPDAHNKGLHCDSLKDADLLKFYGLPPVRSPSEVAGTHTVSVEISATRGAETEKRHRVFEPVNFYEAWSSHNCEQLAKRISPEPRSP